MTDALKRIEEEFEEFRSLVEHCRNEATPDMAVIKDAYDRFYRLSERYEHEHDAHTLSPTEEAALRKVFKKNKVIESVGRLRAIGAHVETGDVELLDPNKVSFTLTAASSEAALFAAPCVNLTDKKGQIIRINHIRWLTEAVDRIARAWQRLKPLAQMPREPLSWVTDISGNYSRHGEPTRLAASSARHRSPASRRDRRRSHG
jgi:hypothetical protein